MNIITKKEKNGRIDDGINTLLNLTDDQFEKVIDKLKKQSENNIIYFDDIRFFYTTDGCESPNNPIVIGLEDKKISRNYYGGRNLFMNELLKRISIKKQEFSQDSKEFKRCEELLNARNIKVYEKSLVEEYPNDREVIAKLFEILQNEDKFLDFLNYNENEEEFKVNDNTKINDYLRYIGKIFGDIKKEHFFRYFDVYTKFYIPELPKIKDRVLQISEKYNVERYSNKKYEFRFDYLPVEIIRKGEEPEWIINPELEEAVFKDIPKELSLEEKAIYMYMKLCKELLYDEGYMYKEKMNSDPYSPDFSKEKLENVKPGSKVTCYEFSRIIAKMINTLEGDIEAVVVAQGINKGHFYSGFYTDNVSVKLELTNNNPISDITRAKAGISFKGICANSDRKKILPGIIEKVYPLILEKEEISVTDYIDILKNTHPQIENSNILKPKLEAFIETMNENNIYGNEFTQLLVETKRILFSYDEVEIANVGRKVDNTFKRIILVRQKKSEINNSDNPIYLIDTENLSLKECNPQEIIEKMNSGEYVYEDNDYTLEGIDKEKL